MLVARRDPPFHMDARDTASAPFHPGAKAPRVVRFVTVVQMIGSLLAVPVGIGSAYTFYRANFSPETTCQSLRSGIIAMLDKGVDAATRRILVRRDIETFEKACATVDPEATAAFKMLLAAEKSVTPVAAAPKVQPNESAAKEPVRKTEPRTQAAPKQAVTNAPAPATQTVHRETVVSDTQWLDAVRQALVTHQEHQRPVDSAKARTLPAPVVRPAQRETEATAPAVTSSPAAALPAAPALPPAIAVIPPPVKPEAAQKQNPDHPVPPESIPDSAQAAADEAKVEEPGRSRIGKWISAIPLLGPVVDNGRH